MKKPLIAGLLLIAGVSGFCVAKAQAPSGVEKWMDASSAMSRQRYSDDWTNWPPTPQLKSDTSNFVAATRNIAKGTDAIEASVRPLLNSEIRAADYEKNQLQFIQIAQNQRLIEQNDEIIRLLRTQKK